MTVRKLENGTYQARFQFDRRRYKKTGATEKPCHHGHALRVLCTKYT